MIRIGACSNKNIGVQIGGDRNWDGRIEAAMCIQGRQGIDDGFYYGVVDLNKF